MTRVFLIFAISIVFLAKVSGAPKRIEKRGGVTYSAEDWSHSIDPRHTVDVIAQPAGGMQPFVSRLDYPAALRQQHVTGVVIAQVSLDARGRLLAAKIVQSVHPTLDAIVLQAVRQAQWKPAARGGKPVPWTFRFPVTFVTRA
jgi:TonB family protein